MFIPESAASSQEINKGKDDETDEKDPSDQGQDKPSQFFYGWPDHISENLQEPRSDTSFQLNMQKISTPVL